MITWRRTFVTVLLILQFMIAGLVLSPARASAAEDAFCAESIGGFFGLPTWYKYLNPTPGDNGCDIDSFRSVNATTDEATYDTGYLFKVGLAIFEIVMRIAGLAALAFVMYGAFQFLTAQGEPDKYAGGRTTLLNALIGLAIALSAVAIVNLVGANIR